MIIINRIGENIVGSVNMKAFSVPYTADLLTAMTKLSTDYEKATTVEDADKITEAFTQLLKVDIKTYIETKCPDLFVNAKTKQFHLKTTSGKISKGAIPEEFANRILDSLELGIDPSPVIKFCIRAMRLEFMTPNKFRKLAIYVNKQIIDKDLYKEFIDKGFSELVATEQAKVFDTPITLEGLLCTYKYSLEIEHKFDKKTGEKIDRYEKEFDEDTGVVKSDGKPKYAEERVFQPPIMKDSGDKFTCTPLGADKGEPGHIMKVGHEIALSNWDQVNTNDNASGVKGLHLGNRDYIKAFDGFNRVLHNCFVDPMYIGAITDDGTGAIRVLKYFIHSSWIAPNKGLYHSSHYAAQTDKEWAEMKEAAIENYNKIIAEKTQNVDSLNDLDF